MKITRITKWKVMQKDSSIGLLLLIVSFFAFLLIVLGPTTIGVDVKKPIFDPHSISDQINQIMHQMSNVDKDLQVGWNHLTLGASNGDGTNMWSNTGEALAVIGMVFAGVSWLAICVGWYVDPTTVDERITLSISAAGILIGMVFAIAGPAYEEHYWTSNGLITDKGYIAGMEILAIIPSILTMLLMIEPLVMVFNPKYKSKAGLEYKKYEQDLEAQESKVSK